MNETTGTAWSADEVAATIDSYFAMLKRELAGEAYNKAQENRKLRARLNGRTQAAVEFKHQNISAVLVELGRIPIFGYKSASNYQRLLADTVEDVLAHDRSLDEATERSILSSQSRPAILGGSIDVISAPSLVIDTAAWTPRESGIRRDYLQRESQNHALGLAGEIAVVAHERRRLQLLGEEKLAAQVEHVSVSKGDGLGFDVRSFDDDGAERMIEVKTTRYRSDIPFFVSRNEVEASTYFGNAFHIYRLFQFEKKPGMFTLRGPVASTCRLTATEFLAAPGPV